MVVPLEPPPPMSRLEIVACSVMAAVCFVAGAVVGGLVVYLSLRP